MTKLYISADLEGVCGVVSPRQCDFKSTDRAAYDQAVRQLGLELNAIIEGAIAGGATSITLNDAHYTMTNLQLDQFRGPYAIPIELISGKPKLCAMAAGLNQQHEGVFFIGYHAMAGTPRAVLCHTFHDQLFEVKINGVAYGEGGINALYASLVHRVPTLLASGDTTFCQEIKGQIPHIEIISTKTPLSFSCAQNRPVSDVLKEMRVQAEKVTKGLQDSASKRNSKLLTLEGPYTLEVTFTTVVAADVGETLPNVSRVGGRTVRATAPHFQEVYQTLQSLYSLLAYIPTL